MIQYVYPDGKVVKEPNKRFSCNELKRIFGGWFKLQWVFENESTDYYMCSMDTYGKKINELPEYNKKIKEEFNCDVYGMAIIAPQSMF